MGEFEDRRILLYSFLKNASSRILTSGAIFVLAGVIQTVVVVVAIDSVVVNHFVGVGVLVVA